MDKPFCLFFFNSNMIIIVEVDNFVFLSFSNLPDFDKKWLKQKCHFGPQNGSK